MQQAGPIESDIIQLREQIRGEIDFSEYVSDEMLRAAVDRAVSARAKEARLTSDQRMQISSRLISAFRGLDILDPLLNDPEVTEIMANSHTEVFYERAGRLHRYPLSFENKDRLEDIIHTIVAKVNRSVNELSPIVDARLPDGSRVNAVLPPVALKGPTLTIRKFPERPLTMERLMEAGTLPMEAAAYLRQSVVDKRNVFISGGTGSGKTTLLNVLAQSIPDGERVITIEDSAELQLRSVSNVVSLETRPANTEGKGEITIRQLIRSALRMRPNRIIVGEVRGAEALDMLQAMNTGHEGSLSTGHANSVKDMLRRLETMAAGGGELPLEVIREQIASSLHVLVHLSRMGDCSRKVVNISELHGLRNGSYQLHPVYERGSGG